MATFTWTVPGTTPTTIEATDKLKFAGAGGFAAKVAVGQYQDTTHVASSVDADDSAGNVPNNVKFISQAGGTAGDSECDIGGGTIDIDALVAGNANLKVNFSDASAVEVTGAIFYAYDGTTPATAPANVDVRAAEIGDANFTQAEGQASALALTDQASATSHDYDIAVSASPETVGLKSAFSFRMELTYS